MCSCLTSLVVRAMELGRAFDLAIYIYIYPIFLNHDIWMYMEYIWNNAFIYSFSVGSLGKNDNEMDVIGLHVKNCTIKNTDNGIRIKTWPGSEASRANNFTFEDIVMVNVSNPILIDQEYCPLHDCNNEVLTFLSCLHKYFLDSQGNKYHSFPFEHKLATDIL